jgi:hypothetical protein
MLENYPYEKGMRLRVSLRPTPPDGNIRADVLVMYPDGSFVKQNIPSTTFFLSFDDAEKAILKDTQKQGYPKRAVEIDQE